MRSVYIETTIPSYYYETRVSPTIRTWRAVTRRWWDQRRAEFRLVTSAYVFAELAFARRPKATRCRALLSDVPRLDDPSGVREVAEYYIDHHLMPAGAQGDAMHLALASMHRIDFLLTWNCRHLANANKIQYLAVLNGRLGLQVPIVTTPLSLMEEGPT